MRVQREITISLGRGRAVILRLRLRVSMRRLSMRTKRKKSERNSDGESEENGVESPKLGDTLTDLDENPKKDKENAGRGLQSNRKSRRSSRSHQTDEQKTTTPTNKQQTMKSKKRQLGDENNMTIDSTEEENENATRQGVNKKRKRDEIKTEKKAGPTSSNRGEAGSDHEYEVEKIVGHRTIKGRRQFLVRWKGYGKDSDTWEQEKDLNCPKLIEDFLGEEAETDIMKSEGMESEKSPKSVKAKASKMEKKKEIKKSKNNNKGQSILSEEEHDSENALVNEDNQKEFEVDKILEVRFKKNKKRVFLIRWKGFSPADDTWEPEENLNCPDLISKFMEKVEKAKTADMRELRTNPSHTKRYTLSTHDTGRRLSRRNMDKQRATYHECDE